MLQTRSPVGRHVEAAEDVEERRFAAAGGAEQDDELAGEQVNIDAAQRLHLDFAHAIDFGEAAGLENRRAARNAAALLNCRGRVDHRAPTEREEGFTGIADFMLLYSRQM